MAGDVIIVGGGLVGAALAQGLAKAGASVAILDEGDGAFRASRANFGLVWVQSKGDGMPDYAAWTRRSSDLWGAYGEELRDATGIDVCHRRPGGFELCLDEAEYETLAGTINRMHNQTNQAGQPGVGANDRVMLDGDEVRRMEPHVSPEVIGAAFCPHDGVVNPLLTLRAQHRMLAAEGVAYHPGCRVEQIIPEAGGFRLLTAQRSFTADRVVLAAGNGSARLGPDLGLAVPVTPERGHILVTERTRPLFNHLITQVRQTDEGTVMLGATKEDVGFDDGINFEMAHEIAASAARKVPILKHLRIVRAWSGLRIMAPDGFPVYQESDAWPGAFSISCHSGVTLAAVHAHALAPKLLESGFNEEFAPFSPRRFDVPKTH